MDTTAIQSEALSRATGSLSFSNYPDIFTGFMEKGIAETDIKPRENVFTYQAWLALGRQVRKGESGIRITTWIPMTKKDATTGQVNPIGRKPRTTTVFHITQTDEAIA